MKRAIYMVVLMGMCVRQSVGQLAITEAMSSATSGPDFWELTNFGTNTINLTGYKWRDSSFTVANADSSPFEQLSIGPWESIIFVENKITAEQFRDWWGTTLPAGLQIIPYVYAGKGLSQDGDSVRLWAPDNVLVDTLEFGP